MISCCKRLVGRTLVLGLFALFGQLTEIRAEESQVDLTIATGRVGGIYHPVGGAICKLVNEGTEKHGISCTIEITSGSIGNLSELRDGDVDLALAQSDWQLEAIQGTGPFEADGPFTELRAVFAPYVEHFTIVAGRDKDINSFEDLRGKRVYMGRPGSGRRQTMEVLMDAFGWGPDDIVDSPEYRASNFAQALCENEFDAFVHTIGNPNPAVKEAVITCGAILVPVVGAPVEKLAEDNPYYVAAVIPKGTYRGQSRDVPTLGLVATVLSTSEQEPEVIYEIVKAFFENISRLREASPLFSSLSTHEMAGTGLTAPLHEGALKYFAEAGL